MFSERRMAWESILLSMLPLAPSVPELDVLQENSKT